MAVWTQIWAGIRRRRTQTAVVLLLCLLASTVSTLALTLLVRSTQPWDAAYAQINGPHAVFHFDASRVTAAELATTASLPDVTQAGPPEPNAVAPFEAPGQKGLIEVIGRTGPGGAFDRLPLAAGRWPERPGEIAVTRTGDSSIPIQPHLGDTIYALNRPDRPAYRVVGEVLDVVPHGVELDYATGIPAAWVLPGQVAALVDGRDVRPGFVMSYRFASAGTAGQLARDEQLVRDALPPGAESAPALGWLQARAGSVWFINLISGIILAFTVFALGGVSVIVGSAVAGAVLANYRDIGVLKALGFTPRQITAAYLGQMVVPALVAAAPGVLIGSLAARPFQTESSAGLGLPLPPLFDATIDVLVPIAVILLVALAALAPAIRAARISAVRAIVMGGSPPAGRHSRLASWLAALRVPRPISLGAGDAFARPVRGALTLVALAIAFATAVFAGGFQQVVDTVVKDRAALGVAQDVVVHRYPGITDAVVSGALSADPATDTIVSTRTIPFRVRGVSDPVEMIAMRGDATALGYRPIQGRWYGTAQGEAVIGPAVAQAAKVRVGDTLSGSIVGAGTLQLRITGIYNDYNAGGRNLRVAWPTLAAGDPGVAPDDYLVKLRGGRNAGAYARRVASLAPDFLQAQATSFADINAQAGLVSGMVFGLAAVLLLIAAAGLLNAALLSAKERVQAMSVLKALGMSSGQVAVMVMSTTIVLCAVGVVVGVPLGAWLEEALWDGILSSAGIIYSVPSAVSPLPLATAILAAVLVALLGASLPARWAIRTPVAAVLRAE